MAPDEGDVHRLISGRGPRLELVLEVEPEEEAQIAAALDGSSTLGAWTDDDGHLHVYYPDDVDPVTEFRAAWRAVAGDRPTPRVSVREVVERDWLAGYRASARPVRISDRLWVAPPDVALPPEAEGATVVRIQPGTGFGTGTHPTTRTILRWLDAEPSRGAVLDVGTGSGVLALAAIARGARSAIGVDVDPAALDNARDNRGRNPNGGRLHLIRGSIDAIAPGVWFERVVANLDARTIRAILPRLAAACAVGGRVGVAGALEHEREAVLGRASAAGLSLALEAVEDDPASGDRWWSAWLAKPV